MKDIFQNMNQYTQLEDMDCNCGSDYKIMKPFLV